MKLKDEQIRGLIVSRLDRLCFGHAGDVEPVGQGISELRIHCGGDKSTQAKDIKAAKRLAAEWSE